MIWLPDPNDRRLQYYIHYLQSWARLTMGIYFYHRDRINTYDAYFSVYLVLGADAIGDLESILLSVFTEPTLQRLPVLRPG
jgi:hypothetical protein